VPSKQLQGQLQTQHSADIGNCIVDKHNVKSTGNYWSKTNIIMQKNIQPNMVGNNNYKHRIFGLQNRNIIIVIVIIIIIIQFNSIRFNTIY
jgi:hypothetical protein